MPAVRNLLRLTWMRLKRNYLPSWADRYMADEDSLFPDETQISVEERLEAEALIVDVQGFEGPLDLLLTLSRTQKVDLRQISVYELARQYLTFVEKAKELRIELAADYLVMAAWLAFLKSRLLLPPTRKKKAPRAKNWRRIWRSSWSACRRCAMPLRG